MAFETTNPGAIIEMSKVNPDVTTVTTKEALHLPESGSGDSYLVMIYGEYLGRRFIINEDPLMVGRSPECDIQLTDDCVSRMHCRIVAGKEGVVISDLDSTNGTYVNGTAISAGILRDADRVKIGRSIFKYLSSDNIEGAYHEEIYRLKTTDGLTGAFNKRYFNEELERELHRFQRYERPLSLLIMDIDHFKQINDEYGHLAGDRVLSQLGLLMSTNIRREDTFCRYGGEEFTVLMPEMDLTGAITMADRLRQLVEEAHFSFEGLDLPVTVSIGVAEADSAMKDVDSFIRVADKRLYSAKENGRNRVEPSPGA